MVFQRTEADKFYHKTCLLPVSEIHSSQFLADLTGKYKARLKEATVFSDGRLKMILFFKDNSMIKVVRSPATSILAIPTTMISLL